MSADNLPKPVLQLRVAITTQEYERLVRFYSAGLGLAPTAEWKAGEHRGLMLEMGEATLEIFEPGYAAYVDELEAGARLSGRIRFAVQVPDLEVAKDRLIANGATLVHAPVKTPWGDYNVRLQDPDGLQVTLFQTGTQSGG